jgi:hypothetical protein
MTPRRPPTRVRLLAALLLLCGAVLPAACADEPRIWFENQRGEVVTVSIDGDRLMIIRPNEGMYLPYSTAAWAWPRRIDVRRLDGSTVSRTYLDASDLAGNDWQMFIRP